MEPKDLPDEEYDQLMDVLPWWKKNEVLGVNVGYRRQRMPPLGYEFRRRLRRLLLRLVWLAGWGWLLFTFGFPGHFAIRWAAEKLKEEDAEADQN